MQPTKKRNNKIQEYLQILKANWKAFRKLFQNYEAQEVQILALEISVKSILKYRHFSTHHTKKRI